MRDVVEGARSRCAPGGRGSPGRARIAVGATLRIDGGDVGEGATVSVEGTYEVTGKIATLGASMIRNKARKLLDEFFSAAEQLS